jgi:hypothetical protein
MGEELTWLHAVDVVYHKSNDCFILDTNKPTDCDFLLGDSRSCGIYKNTEYQISSKPSDRTTATYIEATIDEVEAALILQPTGPELLYVHLYS